MAGYLDLAQRELRAAVVHPFDSVDDLLASPGVDGQIASAEGSLFVHFGGQWERVATEGSHASTAVVEIPIPAEDLQAGAFQFEHGLSGRPVVSVTDATGAVVVLAVTHDAAGQATVFWDDDLPEGCLVTVVGQVGA